MAANKRGIISWIIIAILGIVGIAVGMSIYSSLKDTRAKLKAQEETMAKLEQRNEELQGFLKNEQEKIDSLRQEKEQLAHQRDALRADLVRLNKKYLATLAKIDGLWEAKDVFTELDRYFPTWQGQFHEAQRSDGVHGFIAPRFWGAQVAEEMAELQKRRTEVLLKDSLIVNYQQDSTLTVQEIFHLEGQRDSLKVVYDSLFTEYGILDKKYKKEVKSGWFRFTAPNAVYLGLGAGAGYLIGSAGGSE